MEDVLRSNREIQGQEIAVSRRRRSRPRPAVWIHGREIRRFSSEATRPKRARTRRPGTGWPIPPRWGKRHAGSSKSRAARSPQPVPDGLGSGQFPGQRTDRDKVPRCSPPGGNRAIIHARVRQVWHRSPQEASNGGRLHGLTGALQSASGSPAGAADQVPPAQSYCAPTPCRAVLKRTWSTARPIRSSTQVAKSRKPTGASASRRTRFIASGNKSRLGSPHSAT